MLDLDLAELGAAYYTGNCHKWMCSPKGAGFLHVRADRRAGLRPLAISHGASLPEAERSRFRLELDWTGTQDPSAWLTLPRTIELMGSLLPGGWAELRRRNRALALEARSLLLEALALDGPPCPDQMIGSLAALPLPDGGSAPTSLFSIDELQQRLWREHAIEVPVIAWPAAPRRLLRISAQLYNELSQYARLGDALRRLLA